MIAVCRFIYVAAFCGGVVLAFTEGFWTGLGAFLAVGVMLWVLLTLAEGFQRLRNALSRPQQHLHVYMEHYPNHPDPTRPGWEDEHPLIIINKNGGSNGQNYN